MNLSSFAQNAINHTAELIHLYGPRPAGSNSCLQAAEHLKDDLDSICGNAQLETFITRPGVFNGFFIIEPLLYTFFILFALAGQIRLAAIGLLLTIVYGFLQFGYYKEYFRFLFPKRTCANVCAALEPGQDVRQQIILSGHHDSAYEMRILRRHQKLYAFKVIIPDITIVAGMLGTLVWLGAEVYTHQTPAIAHGLQLMWLLSIPIVCSKLFMVGRHAIPGAGDNLIASSMLVELAKLFAVENQKSNLDHTRILFVSFDAEEAGLRGARAYAHRHRQSLTALPTYMINMDSIYNVNELQFLTSDLNHAVSLDKALAEQCMQAALAAGYPARLEPMKFGGGSTDAAELAKIGVRCTTILAMPTGLIRDGMVYHTMQDLPEAIEPEAVEACLEVVLTVVNQLDQLT